ncbi:HD domain-containing protein [Singulisphaera sp. GP187]|uniref:HD domain-containing protein n=1 Tax=Singulisphaera sp. GP187 TaxID=1882752 RepID=UPI00092BCA4E|nr:HD domain-containing protein [Singulisphaera sp. GP187]SIO62679.1 HD domain-containing protein [Singulisphaera sp. GP187]
MQDRFRKPHQTPRVTARVRNQIAVEAARRMYDILALNPGEVPIRIGDATENEYYSAKRKAAAVLGHRVRPGDLPSDAEVREQVIFLANSRSGIEEPVVEDDEAEEEPTLEALADHVDRFAIYKMRLQPLESVKQNPFQHPEGDALFHSLQVFERARHARPYDEEFLLAALLHDVGKAIDPKAHVAAGVEALRGAVTERTLWLIEHLPDLVALRERTLSQRGRRILDASEYLDDLKLLRDLDEAGRVPGTPVETLDQALAYLRGLEDEAYLDG